MTLLLAVAPMPAWAAPGDIAIELSAPQTVGLGQVFSYDVTIESDPLGSGPIGGTVLTSRLPEGVAFDSVPLGDASPVETFEYDADTRVVTFILKDLTEPLVAFSFAVKQVDRDTKVEHQELVTSLEVTAGQPVTQVPQTATTSVTGDNLYKPSKTFETLAGSNNRVVTYFFDAAPAAQYGVTFTSWAQRMTDTLPAGAVITDQSSGLGAWTTTTNPDGSTTAVWEREGRLGQPDTAIAVPDRQVWLTVSYPESAFPEGVTPPANVVELETRDYAGTWHTQPRATAQSPELGATGGGAVSIVKGEEPGLDQTTFESGKFLSSFDSAASYIAYGEPDLQSLTLSDEAGHSPENAAFFDHFDVYRLTVLFNNSLKAQGVPYSLEYTSSDKPGVWQTYTKTTPTTAEDLRVIVQTVGSQHFTADGYTVGIQLPVGAHLTGWRVTLSPDDATSVGSGAEVRVTTHGAASIASLTDGSVASSPLINTSSVDTVAADGSVFSGSDGLSVDMVDRVPIITHVTGPSSLQVASSGSYLATISNLDPAGRDFTDSIMRVVLPYGVFYDSATGVTPRTDATLVSGVPLPTVDDGLTVTTSSIEIDGMSHQVVELRFAHLPSIRTAGAVKSGSEIGDGFRYNIPVKVQPVAYSASGTAASVTSWATTEAPGFTDVEMGYAPIWFSNDDLDFSPSLAMIAKGATKTVFTSAGGLLLGKLVRSDPASPWAPEAIVEPSGTATWQIYARNVLPNPMDQVVLFDKLPAAGDSRGSTFAVTVNGPVTGAPNGATTEYSIDATSLTTGTWTTDPEGATAVRVSIPSMASGEEVTLEIPTTAPAETVLTGAAVNEALSTGVYQGTPRTFTSTTASVTPLPAPALGLVKTTNSTEYDSAPGAVVAEGSDVTWTYTVTNTGNAVLDDVAVTDEYVDGTGASGTLTPAAAEEGPLLPGQSRTFTTSAPATAGQYQNTARATATAVDADGTPLPQQPAEVSDSSWYFGASGGLEVSKLTQGQDVQGAPGVLVVPGSEVSWTYTVTNSGNVDLTDVVVSDVDAAGNVVFEDTIPVLGAGASVELSASGTAIEGQYENTVSVSAVDPVDGDKTLQASDSSWYFGAVGAIAIDKNVGVAEGGPFTDETTVPSGSSVWWEITVMNAGNSALTDVTVSDPLLGETIEVGILGAGESQRFVLPQEGLLETVVNTAHAAGTSSLGEALIADDDARVEVTTDPGVTDPPTATVDPPVVDPEPTDPGPVTPEPTGSATADPASVQSHDTSGPSAGLATTGAAIAGVLVLGLVLLLGGLLALRLRGRQA